MGNPTLEPKMFVKRLIGLLPAEFRDDVDIAGSITSIDAIQFDIDATITDHSEGQLHWNSDDGTLDIDLPGGNVHLQLGQEVLLRAKAAENITDGDCVYISGASGSRPEISKADKSAFATSLVVGVATEDITSGSNGYITLIGLVRDIDTSHVNAGDLLWLNGSGAFTGTRPTAPSQQIAIGYCLLSHAENGIVAVHADIIPRLVGLSDVYLPAVLDGEQIQWSEANGRWEISHATGYGEVYVNDAAVAQALTTTPVKLTCWDSNGPALRITPDHTNDRVTVLRDGTYKVDVHLSFSHSVAGQIVNFHIYVNQQDTNRGFHRKIGTAGDVGAGSCAGTLELNINDEIEVFAYVNASTGNVTVVDGQLEVNRVS